MIRFCCYCDLTWRPCLFASWVDDLVGRWDSREAERDLVERGHTGELQVSTFLCSSSDRLGVRKTTQGNIDRSGKLKNRWESSVSETQELTNYYSLLFTDVQLCASFVLCWDTMHYKHSFAPFTLLWRQVSSILGAKYMSRIQRIIILWSIFNVKLLISAALIKGPSIVHGLVNWIDFPFTHVLDEVTETCKTAES